MESFLRKIGFGFLTLRQVTFFVVLFAIFGVSAQFNLDLSVNDGHGVARVYAYDAIDAPLLDVDALAVGQYVPMLSADDRKTITDYTVVVGDTVSSIARAHSISQATLIAANSLKGELIRPGDVLRIPPTSGVVHKVQSGDSLASVASKYKSTIKVISRWNAVDGSNVLAEGQELMIPGVEPVIQRASRNVVYDDSRSGGYAPVETYYRAQGQGSLVKPTNGVYTQNYHPYHLAVDIANKIGTPVYAAESGCVTDVRYNGYNGGYGHMIRINHENGMQTLYAHLSTIHVKKGDCVDRGEQIAQMGNTGRSTGPHLHFEVIQNGQKFNPRKYF